MWCDHTQAPCGEGGPGAPVQPSVMKGPWREPVRSPTLGPVWRALAWGGLLFQGKRTRSGNGEQGCQSRGSASGTTALHGLGPTLSPVGLC